ncbi:hypothetical protein KUV50_13445 [Membranicola marinus]|uniref:Lipocalin-like domain-containing protein n=1 Tax=Membranihabitans marinus TaxID=1227546 RepID=A0A953HVY0_9BACT|nr:hypothetical protein [Membranihabitans marinus]MBY5959151.1 hypothetical protein [Membranihabitans marinus]
MKFSFLKSMLIAAALMMGFASCEKDDPEPALPYEDVFGNWEWISTTPGESDEAILADSVDYSQSLKITSDGLYTWKKSDSTSDTTLIESDFQIIEDSTATEQDVFIFQFDDSSLDDQSFYVKSDTLYLDENCEQCDSHVFTRK